MNLKKALEFNPDNPYYKQYLGKTYLKIERYDEAMALLRKALEENPDIPGLNYDMAFLYYKMENYSQAAMLFEEIASEEPENILAYYHGGISLYKIKEYQRAANFLMNASKLSPTIKPSGYYYAGVCYMHMGDIVKAKNLFIYVKENSDSKSLKDHASMWLETIKNREKEQLPYNIYVKLGYQYDSNVRLAALNEDIYSNKDDYVTVGYFSGSYRFINKQEYVLGAGYNHFQNWHNDLEQYDLIGSIFNIYGQYHTGALTYSLSFLPHFYWVDSSRYMRKQQLKPEISYKISDELLLRFSYSFYWNNHLRDDGRDGHTNDPSLTLYYSLKDRQGYLFAGIGYEDESTTHPDHDYDKWNVNAGLSHQIPWDLNLNISGKSSSRDYDNVNSLYSVKREDRKYNGSISLSRQMFYDWLNIVGEFNYTKNRSNIKEFEYKRKIWTLSLTARF
ncbi:MAG: DUF560 domain-containing protein [Deltaproteobacteria bacterium]|nr:DUF560 domain-containing protein [Deltaproteobacteria bacterium]